MTEPVQPSLEGILQLCAQAAPEPWYPTTYAKAAGIARDDLDPYLDRLRLGGLIHLTDWMQGHGQGYALTAEGVQVVQNPRVLAQLRAGQLPARRSPPVAAPASRSAPTTSWDRGEAVRAALFSESTPFVTLALLALNILVFLAGAALAYRQNPNSLSIFIANGLPSILHLTGAASASDVFGKGEWWRLLTCCFVHIGLIHLGVNMYALYVVGPHLERLWGHVGFLTLYLLAGLGGSCLAVIAMPNPLAGASGALWGILASEAAWLLLNRQHLPPQVVSLWWRQLLSVFVLNAFISFLPGISKEAHFGGGIAGLVIGWLLHFCRFEYGWKRLLALLGILAIPLLYTGALLWAKQRYDSVHPQRRVAPESLSLAQLQGIEQRAWFIYQDKARLLQQPPGERPGAQVEQAIKLSEDQRRFLSDCARFLKQVPSDDADVDRVRQAGVKLFEAEAALFFQLERCLREGADCAEADQDQIDQQAHRVGQLRRTWLQRIAR